LALAAGRRLRIQRGNIQLAIKVNLKNSGLGHLIFVGGIHGVGKTSFSAKLASTLSIDHLGASELIARAKGHSESVDKQVADIAKNQDLLVARLTLARKEHRPVILDGHFCLLGSGGQIENVPVETFEQFFPCATVVLIGEVSQVQQRLKHRDARDYSLELLTRFQEAELDHARQVCGILGIPILVASCEADEQAIPFVRRHLQLDRR
jgi:adenylate kinase